MIATIYKHPQMRILKDKLSIRFLLISDLYVSSMIIKSITNTKLSIFTTL